MVSLMSNLAAFVRLEISFWLIGLVSIVVYQMLTGRINTRRMLHEKDEAHRYSPGRLQLLVLVLANAFFYLLQVVQNPTRLPEIPPELVLGLGGSNAIYLGGKLYSLLLRKQA